VENILCAPKPESFLTRHSPEIRIDEKIGAATLPAVNSRGFWFYYWFSWAFYFRPANLLWRLL
jgi:hypothetical protein